MAKTWMTAAEQLFGETWIMPLAEVLGVNRRTVERWKTGRTPIPHDIEVDIIALARPGLGTTYGRLLRLRARGVDLAEMEAALAQLRGDVRTREERGALPAIKALEPIPSRRAAE